MSILLSEHSGISRWQMPRLHGTTFQHVVAFERPIPPLLSSRVFSQSPYHARYTAQLRERRPHATLQRKQSSYHSPKPQLQPPASIASRSDPGRSTRKTSTDHARGFFTSSSTGSDQALVRRGVYGTHGFYQNNELLDPEEAERRERELFEEDDIDDHYYAESSTFWRTGRRRWHTQRVLWYRFSDLLVKHRLHHFAPAHRRRAYYTVRRAELGDSGTVTPTFSRKWARAIATLTQATSQYERTGEGRLHAHEFVYPTQVTAIIQEYEREATSLDSAADFWHNQNLKIRTQRWPLLMLHYLQGLPDRALSLLMSIIAYYKPPAQHVTDAVDLVARILQADDIVGQESGVRKGVQLWDAMRYAVLQYPTTPPFSQRSIRYALRSLNPADLPYALETLLSRNIFLDTKILLESTRTLAAAGDSKTALLVLGESLRAGADVQSKGIETTVAKIVRCAKDESDHPSHMSRLISNLSDLSVPLTVTTYNVLLLGAVEVGDAETAWKMYDTIRASDIELDEYTWGIMFKLSRTTDNRMGHRRLYRELNPEETDLVGPWLIAELLECRQHFNSRDNFNHLLRLYERHCDLQPLKDLGILHASYRSRFEDWYTAPRPFPTSVTLTIMLLKYLESCYKAVPIISLYLKFKKLVTLGDPSMVALAASDHVWNGFFKALSSTDAFLNMSYDRSEYVPIYWLDMLNVMTRIPRSDIINPETGRPFDKIEPSRQTYNILLNAHSRQGNIIQVNQILAMMQRADVSPDIVTWNSCLSGFCRFQHLGLVTTILERVKDAGLTPDEHSGEALQLMEDRQGILQVLRDLDFEQCDLTGQPRDVPAKPLVDRSDSLGNQKAVLKSVDLERRKRFALRMFALSTAVKAQSRGSPQPEQSRSKLRRRARRRTSR